MLIRILINKLQVLVLEIQAKNQCQSVTNNSNNT
jgi:hypothetical protein